MKFKNVMAGVATLTLAVPLFTSSAFAAWDGTQKDAGNPTYVSYENTLAIPDPDNPTNPQYAVTVPSSIQFTDSNKKIDVSIGMKTVNGGTMPSFPLHIGVKSSNGYKLKLGTAELDYDLQYGVTGSVKAAANTAKELGIFNANSASGTKISGTAILSGTAVATGRYTDTLTYSISKTTIH